MKEVFGDKDMNDLLLKLSGDVDHRKWREIIRRELKWQCHELNMNCILLLPTHPGYHELRAVKRVSLSVLMAIFQLNLG